MAEIEPYVISVPDSKLEELHQKLSTAIFPDELDDSAWERGSPLADVKRLAGYWKDKFDWRAVELKLNELPNFRTTIQADGFEPLAIHFVHQQTSVIGAIPLLFVHGWPGNFLEVAKLLPLLAAGDGKAVPAFHVVALSLPNFGFSEGSKKKGFGLAQYAETCNKLMLKLGYTEYVTQGGDWGAVVTRTMGYLYPKHVKGSHINMPLCKPPRWTRNPIVALQHAITPYSARDLMGFARSRWFDEEGFGYNQEQSTKPQTIGYALVDSPVGLLAWIYEKLHDWTDEYPWTEDEVLTWVSIYQFSTAGVAANMRIYYETMHPMPGGVQPTQVSEYVPHVKLGVAHFPKELKVFPHSWIKTLGPVVYQSENTHGGHFAAFEHPEVIARDLQSMFGKGGGAYGAVKGKGGYDKLAAKL